MMPVQDYGITMSGLVEFTYYLHYAQWSLWYTFTEVQFAFAEKSVCMLLYFV